MESQIMMIGAAIFVGSAILIYIISIFGIREKTYDEVIEEQRRERMESMKTKVRVEKRDKYKKKYKKPGKEKDDREDSVEKREDTPVFEESVQAAKMVELEIEPEIIEPVGTPKLKAKKAKKQKPILVNKEEKSYTQVDQEVPETFHPKHLPKDEIEMKHAHEEEVKKDVAPRVNKTKKRHEPVAEKIEKTRHVDVESEIIVSQVAPQMAAPPMPAPEKVKKIKKRQEEPVENGSGDVFPSQDFAATLRHANMTDAEIQGLIDILLNKQAGKMEWNKKAGKSDPITVLKKQLEDKEKSLQEEQQLAMSHQSRIKEMQKELQQEKGRYLVLNKTSQEKVEAKEQECLALQRRMQQAHEQHVQEMSKAKMQMGDGQAAMMVQRLQEENKQLKDAAGKAQMNSMPGPDTSGLQQQLKIVQGELNNNVIKLSALDNAKRALEQKVNRYEEQLRKSEGSKKETEAVCTRKLQEVQEELRKLQNRNSNSDKEYERVSHGKETAETECAFLKNRLQQFESSHGAAVGDLESKLKEAHGSKSELDNKIRHLESLIAEKDKLVKAKESEMKEVVEENRELRSCRQRQAGEGEESPKKPAGAPNGDVHPEEKIESKIAITEHEKILNQLQSDMQTKDSTIATLQNDLESQKKKNNALREKNWKAMDALSQTEKMTADIPQLRRELGEKDAEINRLSEDLEKHQSKCSELSEQFQQVSAEQEQLRKEQEVVTILREELTSAKTALETVLGEMSEKQKQCDELSAKYEKATEEVSAGASSAQNVSELEEQLTVMSAQLDQLREDFENKQQENVDLLERYQKISEQLITMTSDQGASDSLQQELRETKSELDQMRGVLEQTTQEKEDLREKNWKAMEALNKAEDGVKQRIADALHSNKSGEKDKQILDLLHLLKENSTTIVQEEINKVRQKLSKIFPDISVDIDDEENSDWWDEFEEKAKDHITSVARRQSMHVEVKLNESLEVQTKLQTQVEHYKTVLGDTESMLNKLQSSVETEEKKWQEKLSVTEKELHAAKNEMESLQESVTLQMKGSTEDLHDLGFAYRCVEKSLTTIVDEMEVKVESLEAQLDESEKEKEVLSTELKESEEKNRLLDEELSSVQREKETLQSELKESQDILSSVKSELEKLKVSLAAQEQIKKQALLQESRLLELDSVKAQLASEKSSKEELAQSNAKINSLLKTGQEALQQEQAMVKKLQAQLEEAKKTNADAESKEIAELKSKLDEREKQLEREIASNQALSQKLPIKPPMPKTRKRSVFKGIHVGHFSCFMDGWFQASLHIRQRSACNNLYIIYFSR
ncbi:ribosome-binding protein 1-like isoform X3 [Lineus longissimus]|uniref:ribosome-binding protein 1-like isoform X3 n=1 Tax=Lineus longissimus TaxID=88925 RepID=UPI00315CA2F5